MPYLADINKIDLDSGRRPNHPGELNYTLTKVALQYVEDCGLSYKTINDILGAFDGASKEFYRRVAAPYEDKKIAENGDVYPCVS